MKKSLEEIFKSQRHAAVLKLLEVASAHRLNHRVLQEALCQIGIPSSAEQVQAALDWCAEQHLLEQEGGLHYRPPYPARRRHGWRQSTRAWRGAFIGVKCTAGGAGKAQPSNNSPVADRAGMGEAVVEQAQARHGKEYHISLFHGVKGTCSLAGCGAAPHKPLVKTRGGVWGSAPQTLGENKRRGVLWTREVIALRRAPFAEQLDALVRVFSNDKVVRTSLDQTGMGEAVVEQAQARHGKEYHISLFHGTKRTCSLAGCGAAFHKPLAKTRGGEWGSAPQPPWLATCALYAERNATIGHADHFWAHMLAIQSAQGGRISYGSPCAKSAVQAWGRTPQT